jgi:hypothetical protein
MPEKHLSSQFDSELNSASARVMELGGLVESQLRQAIYALTQFSTEAADQVIETMGRIGRRIPEEFRETARGGLAALPSPVCDSCRGGCGGA